jgi:hypothetical protein
VAFGAQSVKEPTQGAEREKMRAQDKILKGRTVSKMEEEA